MTYFKDLPIGAMFACNGNIWCKHGKQVATGVSPVILPRMAYFKDSELCRRL